MGKKMSKYTHINLHSYLKQDAKLIKKSITKKESITNILNSLSTFFGYRHYHELRVIEKKSSSNIYKQFHGFINLSKISFSQLIIIKNEYNEFVKNLYKLDEFDSKIKNINLDAVNFKIDKSNDIFNELKGVACKFNLNHKILYSANYIYNLFSQSKKHYINTDDESVDSLKFLNSNYSCGNIQSTYNEININHDLYLMECISCGIGKNKIIFSSHQYRDLINNTKEISTVKDLFFDENMRFFKNENLMNITYINSDNDLKDGSIYSLNSYLCFSSIQPIVDKSISLAGKDMSITQSGYDFNLTFDENVTRYIILILLKEMKDVLYDIKYSEDFNVKGKIWKKIKKEEYSKSGAFNEYSNMYIYSDHTQMSKVSVSSFEDDMSGEIEYSNDYLDNMLNNLKERLYMIMDKKFKIIKENFNEEMVEQDRINNVVSSNYDESNCLIRLPCSII